MDFFDDVVNKAKDVFDVAYKKTEEVITTEKQSFDISLLKSKNEKDFAVLGKLYFESVKDAEPVEGAVGEVIERIKSRQQRIAELSAEIQRSKNKDICGSCGAGVQKGSTFCSACGAKMGE